MRSGAKDCTPPGRAVTPKGAKGMENGILLLVDDDRDFCRLFERNCPGQRVIVAHDIDHGIRLAASLYPEYVFLDVRFDSPFRTGLDAIGDIKKESPFTKVVIVTAAANEYDRDRALRAGAHAYCDKTGLVSGDGSARRELERAVLQARRRRPAASPLWRQVASSAVAATKKH